MTRDAALEAIGAGIDALAGVEHPGSLVTGWAIVYTAQDSFDKDAPETMDTDARPAQPAHSTFGLLALGADLVQRSRE